METALGSIRDIDDPIMAAGVLAFRLTAAQGFTEGNKRTALLLARWALEKNGLGRRRLLDPEDRELATFSSTQPQAKTLRPTSWPTSMIAPEGAGERATPHHLFLK